MWWVFAVEFGKDQLGIQEGDQLGKSISTLPGREGEPGKRQMLKPDMCIFKDVKFKDKKEVIKKLRGILDMTAMPLPSVGYSDSNERYVIDGTSWYATKFLDYLAAIARDSFYTGEEGVCVLAGLSARAIVEALRGNLGLKISLTDNQEVQVRGQDGLLSQVKETQHTSAMRLDFKLFSSFNTDLNDDENAAIVRFMNTIIKQRQAGGSQPVRFELAGDVKTFDPVQRGLSSWSDSAVDVARALEHWMQEEGIVGMHTTGHWVDTSDGWEFQTLAYSDARIEQLTGDSRIQDQDKADFDKMPSRLRVKIESSSYSLLDVLKNAMSLQENTATFYTRENRVSVNKLMESAYSPDFAAMATTSRYQIFTMALRTWLRNFGLDIAKRGEAIGTESLVEWLSKSGTLKKWHFITLPIIPNSENVGKIKAYNSNRAALGKDHAVVIRLSVEPRLTIGVYVRADDYRIPSEFRGYHKFYSLNPDSPIQNQLVGLRKDVEEFLRKLTVATLAVSTSSPIPAMDTTHRRSYFEEELTSLATADPEITFDPATNVNWAADGKTCTIHYTYHGYNMQAVVNWQTGEATVSEVGGNVWASGIGISPDLLQRGADARLEITSGLTAMNDIDNNVGFMIVPHSARGDDPVAPGAELHPIEGGSAFIVDLLAGDLSAEISSWERIGVFRITAMNTAKTNMIVEQLMLNDDNEWTTVHQFTLSRDECISMFRIYGNLVTEARARGWTIHDTTENPTKIYTTFDIKDEAGTTIARIEKGAQGRFTIEVLQHNFQLEDGATVTVPELKWGEMKVDPDTGDEKFELFTLKGAERVFETIEKARSFFENMAKKGCALSEMTLARERFAGTKGNEEFVIRGTLTLPTSLGMSTDPTKKVLVKYFPTLDALRVGTPSDTWLSTPVTGGLTRLVDIITAFKARFPTATSLELSVGLQSRLMLEASAPGADFGGGVHLDASITANLQLDITSQAALGNPLDVRCIGIVGMATIGGTACTIRLSPAKLTEARLGALVRTLNGLATSGIPITSIETSKKGNVEYLLVDPIIFMVTFGSGRQVAIRVGNVAAWGNNLRIAVGFDTHRGWDSPLSMIPQSTWDHRTIDRANRFHTVYLDGTNNPVQQYNDESNEYPIRFDQWLIHHLLGESYFAAFMDAPLTDATYKAKLKEACDIAGIATDANGVPIQSLENDLNNILPWFLLYAAQAGNTEKTPSGTPVSFLAWLATQGVTDITRLAPAQLFALMKEYGLEPGPGFIQPRVDDTD